MLKMHFGALAAATLLVQLAVLSSVQPANAGESSHAMIERGLERAAAAEATGPEAIGDIAGTFRVSGIIRKKSGGLTSCSCYVNFSHFNLQGGDYYTYGNKTIAGKACKMNLPFRFQKGDTGRPVIVTMTANCSGGPVYRYFSADLDDIPLKSGNSKVVKFDIDM